MNWNNSENDLMKNGEIGKAYFALTAALENNDFRKAAKHQHELAKLGIPMKLVPPFLLVIESTVQKRSSRLLSKLFDTSQKE